MEKEEIKEQSFSLIKFITVDLLLNVLLQLVLQAFLQQYFDNYIIPLFIGVAVLAIVVAISFIIYNTHIKEGLMAKKETKMIQSNRDKIQALQTELFQDYFEIQMTAYSASWKNEVLEVALAKQNSNYSTYREIKNKFDEKGVDGITIKDFDVTAISTLMKYDFQSQCCLDNQLKRCISHIVIDRNGFSHISNYKDTQSIFALEETAVDNIEAFLIHLKMVWDYPQKDAFFRPYLGTGNDDGMLGEIRKAIASELNDEREHNSFILRYLQELQIVRDERTKQYVALSYNRDGHNDERKLLDELIENNVIS